MQESFLGRKIKFDIIKKPDTILRAKDELTLLNDMKTILHAKTKNS